MYYWWIPVMQIIHTSSLQSEKKGINLISNSKVTAYPLILVCVCERERVDVRPILSHNFYEEVTLRM